MSKRIVVAVDAMGGDHAPLEIIKGAGESLENPNINIVLVGNEKIINEQIKSFDRERITVVNATEVIEAHETPTKAIKQKKDSSMVMGLKLLKEGRVDAFVSAGNTGALLTGATLIAGRIEGIERPALGTMLPTKTGFTFLIDSGANVDCKPSYLAQFGKMGQVYMETVGGVKNPKVGLVNIGSEEEKGNALSKEAYPLLKDSGINFIGNVEARDIPGGAADVIVCDAFTGNVILKYTEGFAVAMFDMLKKDLMSSTLSKIGALMAKNGFRRFKKRLEYEEIGGAPFLGLNGLVVKAHGSSNARAIKSAIGQCTAFCENDFIKKLKHKL